MAKRLRLDKLLFERGLVDSLERASALILAGKAIVNGEKVDKAGASVSSDSVVTILSSPDHVGRGALKLEAAFEKFSVSAEGAVCADVGASTGGFTEVLLSKGASRVYAIDVGYGELDWRLRSDPRVVSLERTNVRFLKELPEKVSLITVDLSFISLRLVLPVVVNWLCQAADIILLIKPQFEVRQSEVGEKGIVTDRQLHKRVVKEIISAAAEIGIKTCGVVPSPIKGRKGNQEYLAWMVRGKGELADIDRLLEAI
ncbi:MAG: TlyA family RNA methyltransferase [Deltaproteobacteria bacterium]|nr:TlyA family RNA methyltransferase [Deltaproteobacteria bacterium]